MSNDIRIKKGLDINLKGEAEKAKEAAIISNFFTIRPEDFHSVTPKLVAKEGSHLNSTVRLKDLKCHQMKNFHHTALAVATRQSMTFVQIAI